MPSKGKNCNPRGRRKTVAVVGPFLEPPRSFGARLLTAKNASMVEFHRQLHDVDPETGMVEVERQTHRLKPHIVIVSEHADEETKHAGLKWAKDMDIFLLQEANNWREVCNICSRHEEVKWLHKLLLEANVPAEKGLKLYQTGLRYILRKQGWTATRDEIGKEFGPRMQAALSRLAHKGPIEVENDCYLIPSGYYREACRRAGWPDGVPDCDGNPVTMAEEPEPLQPLRPLPSPLLQPRKLPEPDEQAEAIRELAEAVCGLTAAVNMVGNFLRGNQEDSRRLEQVKSLLEDD